MNKQTQFHVGYWLAAIIGILLLQHFYSISQRIEALPYSQFQQLLQEGKVDRVAVSDRYIQGTLKEPLPNGKKQFVTTRVDSQLAGDLQFLQFHGVFDHAKSFNHASERSRGDSLGRRPEFRVAFDGHLVRLERQPRHPPAGRLGAERGLDEPLGEQLDVGGVALRRPGVPEVRREQRVAVGGQQQRGVGAGQAGEVADVGSGGDERGVRVRFPDELLGAAAAGGVNVRHACRL